MPEANATQTLSYPRCIFIRLCLWQTVFPPAERGAVQLELIWHWVTLSISTPLLTLWLREELLPKLLLPSPFWARQVGQEPSEILCILTGTSLMMEKMAWDWRRCTKCGFPQFLQSLHSFTDPTKLKFLYSPLKDIVSLMISCQKVAQTSHFILHQNSFSDFTFLQQMLVSATEMCFRSTRIIFTVKEVQVTFANIKMCIFRFMHSFRTIESLELEGTSSHLVI